MIKFDSILKLNGFPIEEAKKELERVQSLCDEAFGAWKDAKLKEIVTFHFHNNPFYRNDILKGKLPSKWAEIPVLRKSDFQKDITAVISNSFSKKDLRIHNTSGSSGHPFVFAKDKFCHAMTWAVIQNRYSWHDISLNDKQARFYGIPLTTKSHLKEKLKDSISNRIRFPVFDLSNKVLEVFLNRFRNNKIRYIYGYTSSISLFAKYLSEQGVLLKQECPTLQKCIVTSEVCTLEDKLTIEEAFGVQVVNEYGAAELDFIAFEDQNSHWLINCESLHVEVVDEDNEIVREGQPGKIVVTALYNKAMPFIRYELGDIGIVEEEKIGRYKILKELSGRTNDFALLPSGKKSPGLTFYYISKSLLEKGSKIKEFIIRQVNYETFIFEYVSSCTLNPKEEETVLNMMDLYLEPGLKAKFIRKDRIIRPASGKLKHFYSEIDPK